MQQQKKNKKEEVEDFGCKDKENSHTYMKYKKMVPTTLVDYQVVCGKCSEKKDMTVSTRNEINNYERSKTGPEHCSCFKYLNEIWEIKT